MSVKQPPFSSYQAKYQQSLYQPAIRHAPIPVNFDERAPTVKSYHVRLNHWELCALQTVADQEMVSKQDIARRALHEYLARKLKSLGIAINPNTDMGQSRD